MGVPQSVWGSGDNLQESVLSYCYVDPRIKLEESALTGTFIHGDVSLGPCLFVCLVVVELGLL